VVTGSLNGTKLTAQLASFDSLKLSDVQVLAPSGSVLDAKITLTVNGVEYSTQSDIGDTLGANQTYKLVSAEDANEFFEFTVGNTAIDLSTADNAASARAALKEAFGAVSGASGLSFQIGATAEDSLTVTLGSAKTDDLFGGATLSVATQEDAAAASLVLDDALSTITSLRANVGALQSRFNYASANIQASVQNQDAARGELLDTDIANESTSYATSQVKLQAGISVLAQANQQLQALLKLIG
jgi:flagellin-like hook-associated protein FlgL